MDDQRLMHQTGNMNSGGGMPMNQGYNMGQSGHEESTDQRSKQEMGEILQQIMTITDQSLDEAQARSW